MVLDGTLLTSEPDDRRSQPGIGSQDTVIAVTVNAWWRNEERESLEELEGGERESGAAAWRGTGKTIDDALASGRAGAGGLQPFEGEGRTGTVAQESLEPSTVTGRDVNRRTMLNPPVACQPSISSVT